MNQRQMYVFRGIDKQKTIDDAIRKSNEDFVIVHLHSKGDERQHYKHLQYDAGKLVAEWGEVDGSTTTPVDKGQ